jgi:hypothetical protein
MSAKDYREAWSRAALSNRCGDHRPPPFAIKLISIFRRKASGNSGLTVFWYEGPALISCCIVRLVTRLLLANKTMNRELLRSQHHQVQRISTSSKFTVTICWQVKPHHTLQIADRGLVHNFTAQIPSLTLCQVSEVAVESAVRRFWLHSQASR